MIEVLALLKKIRSFYDGVREVFHTKSNSASSITYNIDVRNSQNCPLIVLSPEMTPEQASSFLSRIQPLPSPSLSASPPKRVRKVSNRLKNSATGSSGLPPRTTAAPVSKKSRASARSWPPAGWLLPRSVLWGVRSSAVRPAELSARSPGPASPNTTPTFMPKACAAAGPSSLLGSTMPVPRQRGKSCSITNGWTPPFVAPFTAKAAGLRSTKARHLTLLSRLPRSAAAISGAVFN